MSELTPNLDPAGMSDPAFEPDTTRREAMRRGLTAGGALAAAFTVPLLLRTRSAFAQALERHRDPRGGGHRRKPRPWSPTRPWPAADCSAARSRSLITLFGNQEEEHFNELVRLLEDMGGEEPEKPEPADIPGLGGLIGEPQILGFAIEVENKLIQEYVGAFENLSDPEAAEDHLTDHVQRRPAPGHAAARDRREPGRSGAFGV